MNLNLFKNKIISVICLLMIFTASIFCSAFAEDSSMLNEIYDFNDLQIGSNPPTALANSSCKGTGSAKIAEDEQTGDKYMRLECSYSGNDQALVNYDRINKLTGSLYIEFDFLSENSYGRLPVALNVTLKDGTTTNLYPLITGYATYNKEDWSLKSPGSLMINDGSGEKYAMERKDNVWYNIKSYTNLENKKMTVIITEEGNDPQVFDYDIAVDAVSYHYLRFTIPGWSIQGLAPDGEYSKCRIDNLKIENVPSLALVSSTPAIDSSEAFPAQNLELTFNNRVEKLNVEINGQEVTSDMLSEDGKVFTYEPPVSEPWKWGELYEITGSATDAFGVEAKINQSFCVKEQPQMWIESLGFFDENGSKITEIENGTISSKMRFWQSVDAKYTAFIALYKEHDGRVEMVSLSCDEIEVTASSEPTLKDIPILVNRADGVDDSYFVKVYIWKSLSDRTAYAKDVCYGKRTLD